MKYLTELKKHKAQILTLLVDIFVLAVAISIFFVNIYPQIVPFTPINDIVPQHVTSDLIINGYPAFHYDDKIPVTAIKCNTTNEEIIILGEYSWVMQGESRKVTTSVSGTARRAPGCQTYKFEHIIPQGVTAGLWRIEGYDRTSNGFRDQIVGWYSDTFLIIP